MPEMQPLEDTWASLVEQAFFVMLDPQQATDFKTVRDGMAGHVINSVRSHLKAEGHSLSDEDIDLIYNRSDAFFFPMALEKFQRSWFAAGQTFEYVLRLAVHAPVFASVRSAHKIIMHENENSDDGYTGEGPLWRSWSYFRPVSHLILGYALSGISFDKVSNIFGHVLDVDAAKPSDKDVPINQTGVSEYVDRLIENPNDFINFIDNDARQWLGISEHLRVLGEKHFSHGQKSKGHSLLDPNTTWRVPERFDVPNVPIELEPLEPAQMDILHGVN